MLCERRGTRRALPRHGIIMWTDRCGHCKNLKPVYIESAAKLKSKGFKLAAIDCDVNKGICGQYQVRGFPTIKFFGQNKNRCVCQQKVCQSVSPSSQPPVPCAFHRSPEDYQGGRDTNSIVEFATSNGAKATPPPEVKELIDDHVFEQHCLGSEDEVAAKQLCFIAFLPDILDSKVLLGVMNAVNVKEGQIVCSKTVVFEVAFFSVPQLTAGLWTQRLHQDHEKAGRQVQREALQLAVGERGSAGSTRGARRIQSLTGRCSALVDTHSYHTLTITPRQRPTLASAGLAILPSWHSNPRTASSRCPRAPSSSTT